MKYRVICTNLNGIFRQVDEFTSKEFAERWTNTINKVEWWNATMEEVNYSESECKFST